LADHDPAAVITSVDIVALDEALHI